MGMFRDYIDKQRELSEMPKYKDHDYLDFEPIDDKSMSFLESQWVELKCYSAKSKQLDKDIKCFINKRKSICIIGLTKWDDFSKSWILEVASYVKLEKSTVTGEHHKCIGVFTKEELRGSKYTLSMYYTLVKHGIKLCSDNEQYQGAKPLWKALSRITPIEIFDEINKTFKDYSMITVKDEEVWSADDSKYHIVLRSK